MEISPPPLFLYQTTTLSLPYSLRTLPIQTRRQTFRRSLEPNQSIVSIVRPSLELENSPLATTTTKMTAHNPYAPYNPSPTMQLSQSTASKGHKVVCAHAPEPYGSAKSMNAGSGVSPGYQPSRTLPSPRQPTPQDVCPRWAIPHLSTTFLHVTATTLPLQHLNKSIG